MEIQTNKGESMGKRLLYGALAISLAAPLPAAASCGAAFCSINTSWSVQGAWGEPGTRFDLRYEYVNLDQPRNGARRVGVGQVTRHHDEAYTVNHNWVAGIEHTFDADWGASVSLPWVDRRHFHVHNHRGGQLHESWKFSEPGDARLLLRRRVSSYEDREETRTGMTGIDFGLKLPTGALGVRNGAGQLAERPLQPGTGTVDVVLGAHTAHALPMKDLSWFAQAMLQVPLHARSGFRPGSRASLDAGLRYEVGDKLGAMLQFNSLYRSRDRGPEAESNDSGGLGLFAGPGLSYALSREIQLYGFIQLPLYQYVNGVQLTMKRAAVLGLSTRF
jgi:hypothetical protein